jgi:hypothetical protein
VFVLIRKILYFGVAKDYRGEKFWLASQLKFRDDPGKRKDKKAHATDSFPTRPTIPYLNYLQTTTVLF